jgi:WD40 repeat protein
MEKSKFVIDTFIKLEGKHLIEGDYKTKAVIKKLDGHKDYIHSMAVLRDGSLCTGAADNKIKIWNTETGKVLQISNFELIFSSVLEHFNRSHLFRVIIL